MRRLSTRFQTVRGGCALSRGASAWGKIAQHDDSRGPFVPAVQMNLFGDETVGQKRYVPPPEIVRNTLNDLLTEMQAAETWPWNSSVVDLHRERTFDYLLNFLPDREEAARWRAALDAEIARLDAAA